MDVRARVEHLVGQACAARHHDVVQLEHGLAAPERFVGKYLHLEQVLCRRGVYGCVPEEGAEGDGARDSGYHDLSADDRLERELRRKLDKPRRRGGFDVAERWAGDVAVHRARTVELRVVEQVERLEPNLEVARLVERHALDEGEVEVLDAGSVEESARRVAQLAERREAE